MPEPETDQTKIALINNNIQFIQRDLGEIKSSIEKLSGVYTTKLQFDELSREVYAIKNSSNLWKLLSPIISSVITATITFLFIFYLQNLK